MYRLQNQNQQQQQRDEEPGRTAIWYRCRKKIRSAMTMLLQLSMHELNNCTYTIAVNLKQRTVIENVVLISGWRKTFRIVICTQVFRDVLQNAICRFQIKVTRTRTGKLLKDKGAVTSFDFGKLEVLEEFPEFWEFSDRKLRWDAFEASEAEGVVEIELSTKRLLNPLLCNASTTSSSCMLLLTKFDAGICVPLCLSIK